MTYQYTDPDGDGLHVTPTTRHGAPALNVRTVRQDGRGSAAVDIPISHVEDVVDGLRAVRREAVGAHPGIRAAQPKDAGTPATPRVLAEVGYERTRQDAKWGEQNHPDGTGPEVDILPGWPARDLANAARNTCQRHAEMGIVTWRDIFGEEACEALAESDPARLRAELIQIAATAVNWIEAIDRRNTTT